MKELNNILTSARNSGDVGLILDKEEELDQVCRQEADKIAGFRLFNEEKPTRAMISLEKKIGGYCNITLNPYLARGGRYLVSFPKNINWFRIIGGFQISRLLG